MGDKSEEDGDVGQRLVMAMDLETTGFIRKAGFEGCPPPDVLWHYEQARVVQIGVAMFDMDTGALVDSHRWLIKPEGFTIPLEATAVHKITTQHALENGVEFDTELMDTLGELIEECDILVNHNIDWYDQPIMASEFHRRQRPDLAALIMSKKTFCTMRRQSSYTSRRSRFEAHPKLFVLYERLFNERSKMVHDSLGDAITAAHCYFKLRPDNPLDARDVEAESQEAGEAESQPLIDDDAYNCLSFSQNSHSQHTDAEAESPPDEDAVADKKGDEQIEPKQANALAGKRGSAELASSKGETKPKAAHASDESDVEDGAAEEEAGDGSTGTKRCKLKT